MLHKYFKVLHHSHIFGFVRQIFLSRFKG